MSSLPPIDPATAGPAAAEALAKASRAFGGSSPNLTRVMANSPATLSGFLDFSGALQDGELEAEVGERIALLVAEQNGCAYCLSAHSYVAENALEIPAAEILAAREGDSADSRIRALLRLASAINLGRGDVSDGILAEAREAGVSDGEIAEVVAHVAANAFTNYFAKAARVAIDFPHVPLREGAA